MNKINVEKVIDYTKVLKNNELLQDMDKILRNENINLKLEIIRLNNIIKEAREYIQDRYNGEVLTHTFDKCNVGELLKILDKGE